MAVDGDDDDSRSWMRHALKNSVLAADVLLSIRRPRNFLIPWQCRLDRSEAAPLSAAAALESKEENERPSTSASAAAPSPMSLRWGRRIRRSGMAREPGIRAARSAAATVKSEKRRASPLSPLEGCSSGSTSWASGDGEDGTSSEAKAAKRRRSFGPAAVVVSSHGGGFPMTHEAVLTIAAPGLANRAPTTKKFTKEELHAVERSLLEDKAKMEKELEELRRAAEKLRASNREMQSSLEKPKAPVTDAKANDTQLSDSPLPNSHQPKRKEFFLPDLNELPCSD